MWQLQGSSALLCTPEFEARLDLARPEVGLHSIRWGAANFPTARLLCLQSVCAAHGEASVLEAYVRGTDLVVVYAPSAERLLRPQLYFRKLAEGLEFIVSAQTDLLGIDSSLSVLSELSANEVLQLRGECFEPFDDDPTPSLSAAEGVFLFRVPGAEVSYVEMVYPTDFANASLTKSKDAPNQVRLVNMLFPEQLEKGVIRRGRLRGVFVPRVADEAAALDAYREFVASATPLTT